MRKPKRLNKADTRQYLVKEDLVDRVYERTTLTKASIDIAVTSFLEVLAEEIVKRQKIRLIGFGVFNVATRKAHLGFNPTTGERLEIPQKYVPQLRFSKEISRELNA